MSRHAGQEKEALQRSLKPEERASAHIRDTSVEDARSDGMALGRKISDEFKRRLGQRRDQPTL